MLHQRPILKLIDNLTPCAIRYYVFFPNTSIPSYMFPDMSISQLHLSRPQNVSFAILSTEDDEGYTLRSGIEVGKSRDWCIWDINMVGNGAFGITMVRKKDMNPSLPEHLFHSNVFEIMWCNNKLEFTISMWLGNFSIKSFCCWHNTKFSVNKNHQLCGKK